MIRRKNIRPFLEGRGKILEAFFLTEHPEVFTLVV
jgi:hypothetical protein